MKKISELFSPLAQSAKSSRKVFFVALLTVSMMAFSFFVIKTTSPAWAANTGLWELLFSSFVGYTPPVKPKIPGPCTLGASGKCCPGDVCKPPVNSSDSPSDYLNSSTSLSDSAANSQPPTQIIPPATTDTSQLSTDRCFLIVPGMSLTNGDMYGEKGVRAYNDENIFQSEEEKGCQSEAFKETLPDIKPRFAAVKDTDFPKATITLGKLTCPVWAVDYSGNEAFKDGGAKKKGTESKINFDIRTKENVEFQKGNRTEQFSVTMKTDLTAITATKANEDIRKGDKDVCKNKSNEECDEKKAGGPNEHVIQAFGNQEEQPTSDQHQQYWGTGDFKVDPTSQESGKTRIVLEPEKYKLPPPGDSDQITMPPKMCPVSIGGNPSCSSSGVEDANQSNNGTSATTSNANADADLVVTKNGSGGGCTYKKSAAKPPKPVDPNVNPLIKPPVTPKPPESPKPPEPQNPQNPSNPDGGQQNPPGGGQNPGGGQQQNPTPYPYYPSPTPPYGVACPQNYAPVCDVNGQTQANRCIAEQQKRVQISHDGECISDGLVVCPQLYAPVCDINNETQPNQCIAEQQKKVQIKHTGACTSVDTTNIAALGDLIKQVVNSGMPKETIASVVESIVRLFSEYIDGTSSVNSGVAVQ